MIIQVNIGTSLVTIQENGAVVKEIKINDETDETLINVNFNYENNHIQARVNNISSRVLPNVVIYADVNGERHCIMSESLQVNDCKEKDILDVIFDILGGFDIRISGRGLISLDEQTVFTIQLENLTFSTELDLRKLIRS